MKDEILVDILLPALEQNFEVYIPRDKAVKELLPLLNELFSEFAKGRFTPSEDTALYDCDSGRVLNKNATADELGLGSGSQLFLI